MGSIEEVMEILWRNNINSYDRYVAQTKETIGEGLDPRWCIASTEEEAYHYFSHILKLKDIITVRKTMRRRSKKKQITRSTKVEQDGIQFASKLELHMYRLLKKNKIPNIYEGKLTPLWMGLILICLHMRRPQEKVAP